MKQIITCNVYKDYNFGGPSILLGINELLKRVIKEEFNIVNLEARKKSNMKNSYFPINTINHALPGKRSLFNCILGGKGVIGIKEIWQNLKKADVVIDLLGICFCDNLVQEHIPKWRYIQRATNVFFISWFAKKICGKSVIKNSASYGPMNTPYNKKLAYYVCNNIFDVIVAREKKSYSALANNGISPSKVLCSPDVANLMPYDENTVDHNKISISVSHQIKRQWNSDENYIECICKLCIYIIDNLNKTIVLIPNEFAPGVYNDVSIANEIIEKVAEVNQSYLSNINILQVEKISATEIKNEISTSEVLISSRYHSCVAGLSSGTPTLVIGWHYKYDELLMLYNQSKWQVSHNNCTSTSLIKMFGEFYQYREVNRNIIMKARKKVFKEIIAQGEKMLSLAGVI